MLSSSTIKKLGITLTEEVIDAIHSDERYIDFMMEMIPEIIMKKLGTEDIDLVTEIAMVTMDNIQLSQRGI